MMKMIHNVTLSLTRLVLWLEKTDGGGLCFHISELCFELFYDIEMAVYEKLNSNFVRKEKITTAEIENVAFHDTDVRQIWSHCSIDMTTEQSNETLLTIIKEFITLRGHSLTSKYMEQYKQTKQKQVRKQKGTRSSLKAKDIK
jgi:hypothetical protein